MAKTKKEVSLDQPFLHTVDGQGVNSGFDGSKYARSLTPGENAQEVMGQSQGFWDSTANIIGRFAGRAIIGTAETGAMLSYGIPKAIQTGDFSKVFDNNITKSIDKVNETLVKNTPFYQTQEERETQYDSVSGVLANMSTTNFWGNTLGEGAGFVASAVFGGRMIGAVGSALYRGTKTALTASRLGRAIAGAANAGEELGMFSKALQEGKLTDKVNSFLRTNKIKDAVAFRTQSLLGNMYEAGVEAKGIKEEILAKKMQEYKEQFNGAEPPESVKIAWENEVNPIANVGFATNLALLQLEGTGMSKFLRGYKETRRTINALQQGENYVAKGKWGKVFDRGKEFLGGSLKEAAQEGGQYAVEKGLTGEFSDKKLSERSIGDYYNAVVKGLEKTFNEKEGIESMIIGGMLGLPAGAVNAYQGAKGDAYGIDILNKNLTRDGIAPILAHTNKAILDNEGNQLEDFADASSKYLFKSAQDRNFYNYVDAHIQSGRFNDLMDKLYERKNMDLTAFNEIAGTDYTESKRHEIMDDLISSAERITKTTDNVESTYAKHPFKSSIIRVLSDLSAYDRRINGIQNKLASEKDPLVREQLGSDLAFLIDDKKKSEAILYKLITSKVDLKNANADPREPTPNEDKSPDEPNDPNAPSSPDKNIEETGLEGMSQEDIDSITGTASIEDFKGKTVKVNGEDVVIEGQKEDGTFRGSSKSGPKEFTPDEIERGSIVPYAPDKDPNFDEDEDNFEEDDLEERKNEDLFNKSFVLDLDNPETSDFMHWSDFQLKDHDSYVKNFPADRVPTSYEINNQDKALSVKDKVINSMGKLADTHRIVVKKDGKNSNVFAIDKDGNKTHIGYFLNSGLNAKKKGGSSLSIGEFIKQYFDTKQGKQKLSTDKNGRSRLLDVFSAWNSLTSSDKETDITDHVRMLSYIDNRKDGKQTTLKEIAESPFADRWKINGEFVIVANDNGNYFPLKGLSTQNKKIAIESLRNNKLMGSLDTQYGILVKRPDSKAYQFIGLRGAKIEDSQKQEYIKRINSVDSVEAAEELANELNKEVFLATNRKILLEDGVGYKVHLKFHAVKSGYFKGKVITLALPKRINGKAQEGVSFKGQQFKMYTAEEAMKMLATKRIYKDESQYQDIKFLTDEYLTTNAEPSLWKTMFRFNHASFIGAEPNKKSDAFTPTPPPKTKPQVTQQEFDNIYTKVSGLFKDIDVTGFLPNENYEEDEIPIVNDPEYIAWHNEKITKANEFFKNNKIEEGQKVKEQYYEKLKDIIKKKLNIDIETKTNTSSAVVQTEVEKNILNNQKAILGKTSDKDAAGNKIDSYYVIATGNTDKYETLEVLDENGNLKKVKGQKFNRVSNALPNNFTGDSSLYNNSRTAGNTIDGIIRNFFNNGITTKPEGISQAAFNSILSELKEMKKDLDAAGQRFLANNIVLWDPETGIAGELDILSVDKNGRFSIYDIKTAKKGKFDSYDKSFGNKPSKRKEHSLQLSAYSNLIYNQYGINISGLSIIPIELEYDDNGVISSTNKLKNFVLTYDTDVNKYVPKASGDKDVKNNIPPADKQYSIVSIDTRVNLSGWLAGAELAKIAYNEGVNIANLTREEYANYAVKHFLKIDDNLLRASRKIRTAISTAQQVYFIRELKNAVTEASDKSFANFAIEVNKIASNPDRAKRILFSDNKNVRVRSGNQIASSWLYFGVNSGIKDGDVFKSYAEFTDVNKIYVNDFKNFLKELQKRGYNGDVKIFSDSRERGASIADHLVMHGASKEDAILGKEVAEGFFRDKIFTTSLGKDQIIDGKMRSYSEVLSMQIEDAVNKNFKNYNPPKENKPTPPPNKPNSPSGKANPFVLSDEELDAAQDEAKNVDLGNVTPSDSSRKKVDDFLPGEDDLNNDEDEGNDRKLKPAFEGDTELVDLDNSIKDALAKITGLEVRFYDSPYNYGEFRNGIIYLNKKVPKGTEWHEAFHGIFSVLSPEERKRVLTIAFNKWGVSREEAQDLRDIYMERTGKDIFLTKGKQWVIDTILEEKIADHFQEFMVDNKKPTILESFFNKLKKLINSLLGIVDQPAFQGFFTEIANGQFKDRQYTGTKGKLKDVRFKVIPGARTVAESRKLIRDITVLYKNRNKKEVLDGLPELVSAPTQMEAFVRYYINILRDKFDANKRDQVAKIIESYETGKLTEDQYNLLQEAEGNYTKANLAKENGKFFPKYLRDKNISMITNEVIRRGNFVEVEGLDEFEGDDDGNHTFFDAHNMESNPKVQRAARSVEGRISDMFFFDDMGNIMTFEGNKVMNNLFHNLSNLNREDYKNALGKLSIGNTDYAKIMKQVYTAYKNEPDFKAQFDTAFDNRFVKAIMLVSSKKTRGTQGRIITANSKNHGKIQMDLWKNESFNKTLNPNIEDISQVATSLGITLEKSTLFDEDGINILEELKDSIQPAQSQPVVDFINSKRVRDLLEALSEVNIKYRMDLGELNFKNAKDKSMYSIMQNSWALNKLAETGYDFGVFVGSKFSSNEGENKYDYGDLDARSHFFTTFGLYENYYTSAQNTQTFTPTYFISQFEGKKTNFVFKGADYSKLSTEDILKIMQVEKERQDVNINAALQELFDDNIPAENLKENYHYFKDRNRSPKVLREEAKAAWLKFKNGDTNRNALPLGFRYSNLPLANNAKINEEVVTKEKYTEMIERQYLNTKEYMSDINVTFMDIISEFGINKATEDVFFKNFLKNQYLNRMLALSKISPDLNQFLGFTDITKRGAGLLASGPSHGDGNFNFAIVEDTYIGSANSTDAQGAESITERINRYLRLGIITQTKSNDTEEANDLKKGYQLLKALEMDDRELVKEIGDDNALLKVDKTVGYGKDQYIKTSVVPIVRYDTSQPAIQGETVTRVINGKNKTFTAVRDTKNGKFYLPYPGKETAWHMLNEMQVNRGTRQEPKYVNTIFAQSAIKKGIRNLINNIDDEGIGNNFVSFEYKDYRLQQENPSGKDEIKDGSQLLQIIDSFFSNDAMIGNQKLKNLSDTMDRLVSELKLHGYEFYGDDIEVEVNGQVYNPFMEYIKNAMQGSHVNDRIQDFFQIKDGKMVNSPNLPMIKIKYEEYLMSYYNKKIASHKVPGNKSTLVTSIFHNTKRLGDKTLTQYEYDDLLKNDPEEAKKVQSSRLKWVSGDSPYAEAVVSEEWLDQIGITIEEWVSLKKAYESDKNSEDGKMFEKVSTALAYRIPTQSQHSMVPIKIVDILPRSYGSTILLPAEITSISGADYDVDSVFIHRHAVYKKGKKLVSFSDDEKSVQESYMRSFKNNSVVQEIFTMLPSQQRQNLLLEKKKLLSLRNQRIEEKEKLDEQYIESGLLDQDPRRLQDYDLEAKDVLDTIKSVNARIKEVNDSLDEVYNSSLGQVLDILGKNKTYTSEDIIREVNYNKLLDIRLKILTSPEGTKLINTPASDLLKPIYNKKYAAVGYPTSESEAEKYFTYSGQDNMLNEYKKVSTGTKAIGGAANINKVASFLQKNGIEITDELWQVLTTLYPSVNFSSSGNMDNDFEMDIVDGKLKIAYDENGKKISKESLKSELLSSNVTCATDNAKDQRLVQFHITDKNISEASVFAMLGIGKNRMSAILLSPIGKKISSVLSSSTGSMSAPVEFAENADKIDKYLSELQAKGAKQIEINDENLIASVQDFNENVRIQNLLKSAKFEGLSVDDKLAIDTQYSIGLLYKNISAITADCYKINTILNFNKTIGRKGTDIDRILAAYNGLEGSQEKPFSFDSSPIKNNRFVDTVKNVCGNLNESLSRKVLSYSPHVNKLTNNVLDSTISKSPYLESLFTNDVNNKFIEFLGTKLFFKKALENNFLGGIDLADKERLNGTKVINAYRKAVGKLQTYAVGKLFIEINFDKEMKPSEKYPFPRIGIDTYSNLSPEDEQEVQESFDKMAASTDPQVSDFVTELFAHVAIHDNYKYLSGSIIGKLSANYLTTINSVYSEDLTNLLTSDLDKISSSFEELFGLKSWQVLSDFAKFYFSDNRNKKRVKELSISQFYLRKRDDEGRTIEKTDIAPIKVDGSTYIVEAPIFAKMKDISTPLLFRIEDRLYIKEYVTDGESFNDPTKGVKKFVYKLVYDIENKVTPKVSLHQYTAEESKYLLEEALAILNEKLNSKKEEAVPEPNNQFNLEGFEGMDMDAILGIVEQMESMQANIQEGPVEPKGEITLDLIEDWVQEGKATTTVRSSKNHNFFYQGKGDGVYLEKTSKKPYNITYKGTVYRKGDMIYGDRNFKMSLDEFAQKEGWQSWEAFSDYKTGAKFAGRDLIDRENFRVHMYAISPSDAEIKMPQGSVTELNIFYGTGENADLSNFAERPFKNAEGIAFKNVEAAFQYAKTYFTTEDNSEIKARLQTADGSTAKAIGRQIKGLNTQVWDNNSSQIMKDLIKTSFIENPSALSKLLATNNATLTHTQEKGKWGTEFPKILMEVRNELRGSQPLTNTTNKVKVKKIISGGQTGVDRIGLEVGKESGIQTGGTATPGFVTESGKDLTLKDFNVEEISNELQAGKSGKEFYLPRTEQNVLNSDGTVYFSTDEDSAGRIATERFAKQYNKPFLLNPTVEQLRNWLISNNIETLNVAGNRGSKLTKEKSEEIKNIIKQALFESTQLAETTKEKTSGTSNPFVLNAEDLEDFMSNPNNFTMDLSTKPLGTTGGTSSASQEGEKLYQEYAKKGGKEDKNKFLSLPKDVQQKMIDCL